MFSINSEILFLFLVSSSKFCFKLFCSVVIFNELKALVFSLISLILFSCSNSIFLQSFSKCSYAVLRNSFSSSYFALSLFNFLMFSSYCNLSSVNFAFSMVYISLFFLSSISDSLCKSLFLFNCSILFK